MEECRLLTTLQHDLSSVTDTVSHSNHSDSNHSNLILVILEVCRSTRILCPYFGTCTYSDLNFQHSSATCTVHYFTSTCTCTLHINYTRNEVYN